ncbi:major facilitator superfamily transporter [Xylariales sp. AK1849]|nr:major facilitator superfamily transporter [Xylariales sp. AK1849]
MSGWKHAFTISGDEIKEATPPGTVRLIEHASKHDVEVAEGSSGITVRSPTPSADPADPLNWPMWRKHALLLVVSLYSFIANFTSSSIAPALQLWPMVFPQDPRPFTELTRLIALNVLFQGAANIWWVPLASILGRRPVLLVSTLMLTLCTLWCGLATNFNSLLAARIFQGIGNAAADTVAPALVGEVYFMNERGRAMAIYTIFLAAGSISGGLAGGYIAFQLGWAYIFWVGTALSAATFVGTVIFVPETLYSRVDQRDAANELQHVDSKEGPTHLELARTRREDYRPYTFMRSLGFMRPQGGLAHHFMQPWRTLLLPGTWVTMLHYGGLVGGIVTISVVGPQIVAEPPYLWGANSGLVNVGGLAGTVLGAIYTYLASDAMLKRTANHESHGFAEPEARLPTIFPALLIATGGFFVFGFCAQYPGPNVWVGLEFGYAMVAFGLMQVPSIDFNYLIDSYSYFAADCFVMVTIFRSIIAFAWTFFVGDWIQSDGAAEAFGIFGMLMGLFALLTIPLWLYGKRMRIATASVLEY